MNGVLVDSNILLDIFTEDHHWFESSSRILVKYSEKYDLFINPVIYSEISQRFKTIEELEEAIPEAIKKMSIPWEAAFLAAKSYLKYKKNGGRRHSPLPDFYIGAHAAVRNLILLSRDTKKLLHYYPNLHLISPEKSV